MFPQFPRTQCDIFKLLVLSDQPKTWTYVIYNNIKMEKILTLEKIEPENIINIQIEDLFSVYSQLKR